MDGEKFRDLPPKPPDTSRIEQPIRIVLETMVRGMVASCGGAPPELILTVIAWHAGNSLGEAIVAADEHKNQFRTMLRNAFLDGISKSGETPVPMPMPPASNARG